MNSKFSLLISFFFLFSNVNNALDITKLFEKYPDFSKFSSYLTQTKLTTDINSRQTITILAVGNGNIAPLSGKPVDVLRKILSLHVILDYYDEKKLQTMQDKSTLLTTLFQVSGQATGQKGFLKVTDTSGGSVAFGLAGAGSAPSANLVNSIHDEPYNISILQISGILAPGGSDAAASPSSSLSTAPSASPTKSPTTTTTTTTGTSATGATTSTTGTTTTGATTATTGTAGATTPTSAPTTAPTINPSKPSTASAVSPSGASTASASGASAASPSGASAASPSGASAASASGASAAAADISPSTHPSTASAAPGTAEDDVDSGADAPSNAAAPASTEADTPDAAPDSPPGPPLGSPPMPAAPTADAPAPAADSAAPGTTLLSHRRVLMIIVPSVIYILFA